jgi:hypothetical protein
MSPLSTHELRGGGNYNELNELMSSLARCSLLFVVVGSAGDLCAQHGVWL